MPEPKHPLPIEAVAAAMLRDQFWLRSQRQRILQKEHNRQDQSEPRARWRRRLAESIALRETRRQNLPTPKLDAELPIAARADEIAAALAAHQVIVLSGETGSGKSTQLPLICLHVGLGVAGFIGHTQPRRIAARSVAARVAEQLQSPPGKIVGYKIRFGDQTSPQTLVKLMTDGILLAETGSDRFLNQYEVIIIDEAHERSLNIDFLLGYLRRLLPRRPDLKLIITSATIDTARFAEHFTIDPAKPVPVIHVEGRTWPVDIQYMPVVSEGERDAGDLDIEQATIDAVMDLGNRDSGDMLVFLPTEQDIRSLAKKLRARLTGSDRGRESEILPLYARLTTEQQNSIFKPGAARRIVLATNVAESSITVPRIRYVVDQGFARISRYAPRSKVQRLPIEAISRASADQRAGRCGRVGPGVCVRLFSEDDYNQRPRFTTPEIRRTNLASVILQTAALHLGPIDEFPFIDPPGNDAIRDGYKTLHEIGAVDEARRMTALGKQLARLPVDPRVGRMLFAGSDNGCLEDVLAIAAALEVQDPRVRPHERSMAADQAHSQWLDDDSDFIALLNLWNWLHARRETLSNSKFRRACSQNYLSFALVQQWMEVHRQLKSLCREHRLHLACDQDNYASIHQSLIAGLLSGVAMLSDRREYIGAGGIKFVLWPGSGVARGKSKPEWVLVAEIVETSQRFGRMVARIDPRWIEPLATHIVRRSYSDPHWSKKQQSAMALEKVSLFGLPVVSGRPIRYGPIDPSHSRQLFIEKGLVEGEMRSEVPFLKHNREVLKEIQSIADKTRQRSFVIDDYAVRNFYERRLPAEAFDWAKLAELIRAAPDLDAQLRFEPGDLIHDESATASKFDFPDSIEIGDLRLPVTYNFAPGTIDDGVNVRVPVEAISQIHENHLGWAVPGLLKSRIAALIRSLPKSIRRNLVPAPETAALVASKIEFGAGPFYEVIAQQLSAVASEPITVNMFRLDKLDDSLKLNLKAIDDQGEVIDQGRSLYELKTKLPQTTGSSAINVVNDTAWQQDDLREWTWNELPAQIVVRRGAADVLLYPTIVDRGDHVQLRLFDHRGASEQATRQGLATLYRIANRKAIRSQVKWLPLDPLLRAGFERMLIQQQKKSKSASSTYPALYDDFDEQLAQLISVMAFVDQKPIPRTAEEFYAGNTNAVEQIGLATQTMARWLPPMIDWSHKVTLLLSEIARRHRYAVDDIDSQLRFLFGKGPLCAVPSEWLEHYPRYLQAIVARVDRLQGGGADRDRQQSADLQSYVVRYDQGRQTLARVGGTDPELETFGWMIQEYRVSLFAQQLGTRETVSPQRLEKQWRKVGMV